MRCRWLFILAALLAAPAARAADATAIKGKDTIEFKVGTELVATYQFAGTVPKEKGEGRKPLSKPVLWPLNAPGVVTVTGFAPSDHIHHKSVWFCHGDVIPEGMELKTKSATRGVRGVDFWDENAGHGRIVCVGVDDPTGGKGQVSVVTRNEWMSPDGAKIMDETRVITFRATPEGRLFTFDITLKAPICPITFGDTKEGSFAIRVNPALEPRKKDGATITTAEGKVVMPPARDNLSIWGHPSAWIDYSGQVKGAAVGIATFDHPANPKPSWHVRAYGLNGANPFGREHSGFPSQKGKTDLVKIEKGGELHLKYAVYAHSGDVKSGKVAEAYELFRK